MTNQAIEISEEDFDSLRAAQNYSGGLIPGQNYDVTDREGDTFFAHSPDGIGVYWYTEKTEREQEHG